MNVDITKANEHVMLKWLLDIAKTFYADKKNQQAFEEWLKARKS